MIVPSRNAYMYMMARLSGAYGVGLATQWSWIRFMAAALSVGWYWDGWPSSGGHTTSVCNQLLRPTQPPTLCETGNEYQLKCGDVLRLGIKGRMAHSVRW